MSKIGKINIAIPDKVKVVMAGNILNIEGPLGKKSLDIDLDIFNLEIKEGKEILIKPKKIDQNTKRLWGMKRSLINNAVIGSSTGYEKILELIGVGYKAQAQGNKINLELGFSHSIIHDLPEGVSAQTPSQTEIVLKSSKKQVVGQVAAEIRAYRPPEPYKGKGVRYDDEHVVMKEAKKA